MSGLVGLVDTGVIGALGAGVTGAPHTGVAGALHTGVATVRLCPDSLQAHPCALDGGHPWPPTVRAKPDRHHALTMAGNFCQGGTAHLSRVTKIQKPFQRAPVEAVRGRGWLFGTVGGHGWPSSSLQGRTCGESRKANPAPVLPAPPAKLRILPQRGASQSQHSNQRQAAAPLVCTRTQPQ